MPRQIDKNDGFLKKLVKLIPSEIIGLYVFFQGVIPKNLLASIVIISIATILTPLYIHVTIKKDPKKVKKKQIKLGYQLSISTISFIVWVFALGSPWEFCGWYPDWRWVFAVIMGTWTFVITKIVDISNVE